LLEFLAYAFAYAYSHGSLFEENVWG